MDQKQEEKEIMEKPANSSSRYVIKAKTPQYYEAIKKLYNSGISRAQVHTILDVTRGNPVGLRVAKHVGMPQIWFIFQGHRFDVKADGTLVKEVKTGPTKIGAPAGARKLKCQLCGNQVNVIPYEVKLRCPECGFQVVRYNIVRRK